MRRKGYQQSKLLFAIVLEKCKGKLLERGKNEIMFAENKEFQAMYKTVRDQVEAVENDDGKVAMDIKARFKQQKDWYEIFYYKKQLMLAYEHTFISWLLLYYTD